jgi:hypothetical protein
MPKIPNFDYKYIYIYIQGYEQNIKFQIYLFLGMHFIKVCCFKRNKLELIIYPVDISM